MAKNDMFVIIYKLLKYLYEAMKEGKRPSYEDICCNCKMYNIPLNYWNSIIKEMTKEGLVEGFIVKSTKDGDLIFMTDNARITMKGVEFLEENKTMKKVKDFLGCAFEVVLETIIKAL